MAKAAFDAVGGGSRSLCHVSGLHDDEAPCPALLNVECLLVDAWSAAACRRCQPIQVVHGVLAPFDFSACPHMPSCRVGMNRGDEHECYAQFPFLCRHPPARPHNGHHHHRFAICSTVLWRRPRSREVLRLVHAPRRASLSGSEWSHTSIISALHH